jgi:hypothetical protein
MRQVTHGLCCLRRLDANNKLENIYPVIGVLSRVRLSRMRVQ